MGGNIIKILKSATGPHAVLLQEKFTSRYENVYNQLNNFGQLIMNVFDLNDGNVRRKPLVRPKFDATLKELDTERRKLNARIDALVKKAQTQWGDPKGSIVKRHEDDSGYAV